MNVQFPEDAALFRRRIPELSTKTDEEIDALYTEFSGGWCAGWLDPRSFDEDGRTMTDLFADWIAEGRA